MQKKPLATVTKTLEKRHNNVERLGKKYDVEVHVLNLNIVALTVYMVSVTLPPSYPGRDIFPAGDETAKN